MTSQQFQSATDLVGENVTSTLGRLAFSVRETAEILGVSEKSVRRLILRGLLHSSRALRHLLISKKEIERFLEETTTK
jgi:excisionase family DNA binding protein